jgi:hypothetical protein
MNWKAYCIVFRLMSPLHVGHLKIGNLMRTRHYVTGKTLWGALTARLTRDFPVLGGDYTAIGERVNEELAFSYFYPALQLDKPLYPHYGEQGLRYGSNQMKPDEFAWRLLSSYASTALNPGHASAEEGSLHDTEFISPYDEETGKPIYLVGYIFERQGCKLPWREVLGRWQLGGERRYGWGRVLAEGMPTAATTFFSHTLELSGERPAVQVEADQPILAHVAAAGEHEARGQIEPFVGRETGADGRFGGSGLQNAQICWEPGSRVGEEAVFEIGAYGLWERASA